MTADQLAEPASPPTIPLDTVLIEVAVDRPRPRRARSQSRTPSASSSRRRSRTLETRQRRPASPVKVTVVQPPTVPTAPVSPEPSRNLALGLLLGLLLGFGLALLRDTLDTRIKSERGPASGHRRRPSSARSPSTPTRRTHPLIVAGRPAARTRAEAFRSLRTNLQFIDVANRPRRSSSPRPCPARASRRRPPTSRSPWPQTGARVVLVEADLRRPRLLDYLGLEGSVGLTYVLIGQAELDDVLQPWRHRR